MVCSHFSEKKRREIRKACQATIRELETELEKTEKEMREVQITMDQTKLNSKA